MRVFLALPPGRKRLLVEAFLELGRARLQLRRPFAQVAPTLGAAMRETPKARADDRERAKVRQIADAIGAMSRHTPWSSMCFTRAVAAMRMLERRGIACTLFLGTGREESGGLAAHAWLRSGDIYLTGAEEMKRFTVVGKFAKPARTKSRMDGSHREEAR